MGKQFPLGKPIGSAKQILEGVYTGISANGEALATEGMSAGVYVKALVDARFFLDALRFVAYSLPPRHSIWWGCLCVLETCPPTAEAPLEQEALAATLEWVVDPSAASRQLVERASLRGNLEAPATLLGRAAAYVDVRLPQPLYCKPHSFPAKGVFSAVWIATSRTPDHREAMRRYITLGFDVSRAKIVWPNEHFPGLGAEVIAQALRSAPQAAAAP